MASSATTESKLGCRVPHPLRVVRSLGLTAATAHTCHLHCWRPRLATLISLYWQGKRHDRRV